jgi:hypothetical protein
MSDVKPFRGINHGTGKIVIQRESVFELKPTEIHLKEDGDKDNNPSFMIVLEGSIGVSVVGQISLRMMNEGLADIGYEVNQIKTTI